MTTITEILAWFKEMVEEKHPIDPGLWLDAAMKLNILCQDLDETVAEAEAVMSVKEAELLAGGDTAAAAKKLARLAVDYKEYLKKRAERKRIDEFIRLAKKKALIEQI